MNKKDYKALKEKLANQTKENYKNKDKSGFTGKSFLNSELMKEVPVLKLKEGYNRLDLLPFIIATEFYPNMSLQIGDLAYIVDVWVHPNIGPANDQYICMKKTYGKPCAVCDEMKRLMDEEGYNWKDDEIQRIKASRKAIYNTIDKNDPDGKIQVFIASFALFEKELLDAACEDEEGEEMISFSDLESGATVKFKAVTEKFNGREYFKYKNFSLKQREAYDFSIIDDCYPLDSFLVIPDYEEIKKLLTMKPDSEEENEEDWEKEANETVEQETGEPEEEKEEEESNGPNPCPFNHEFGTDNDKTDDCVDCDEWEDCYNLQHKMKLESRKKKS